MIYTPNENATLLPQDWFSGYQYGEHGVCCHRPKRSGLVLSTLSRPRSYRTKNGYAVGTLFATKANSGVADDALSWLTLHVVRSGTFLIVEKFIWLARSQYMHLFHQKRRYNRRWHERSKGWNQCNRGSEHTHCRDTTVEHPLKRQNHINNKPPISGS